MIERMDGGAMGRSNCQMQRVTRAEPSRCWSTNVAATGNAPAVTGNTVKLSGISWLNVASAAARWSRLTCPVRSLIAMAEDISVTVQSLGQQSRRILFR